MKDLWSWLTRERELPGPLRYVDVLKLRRLATLKRVIAVVCVVVGLHTVLNIWAYQELQWELGRARAAGIEMDLLSYNSPSSYEARETEKLYRAAFALLELERGQAAQVYRKGWPPRGVPGEEVREALQRLEDDERAALARTLIKEANQRPDWTWGIFHPRVHDLDLRHVVGMQPSAWALTASALHHYLDGDAAGAVDDIGAVVQLARRLEADHTFMSEMVRNGMAQMCRETALRMLQVRAMDAPTAQKLSNQFRALRKGADLSGAFNLETAAAYPRTQTLLEEWNYVNQLFTEEHPIHAWMITSYPLRPLFRWQQARLVSYLVELTEISRRPYYQTKDRLDHLRESLHEEAEQLTLAGAYAAWLPRALRGQASFRASLSTAEAGLAVAAWCAEKGAYPDSLDALVPDLLPELPVDPFTGKHLLYRLTDEELVVYSAAKNGMDDGGLKEEVGERGVLLNPGADDIAWRVPRQDLASD